ncbi:hypothetical protein EV360DRAFT_76351 [Lentinula raphanica]|nr:hypothetical protein EV360DRAFT_76351 [Lentinula raphanica]
MEGRMVTERERRMIKHEKRIDNEAGGVIANCTAPVAQIWLPSFDLCAALKADNNACMAVEDAEESLDDGELDFEDDGELGLEDEALLHEELEDQAGEEALLPVQTPHNSLTPAHSLFRKWKRYSILTRRSRASRASAAMERISNQNVKLFVVELAKKAHPLILKDFDSSSLPISKAGWNTNPCKKLSPGLEKLWKDLKVLSSLSGLKLLAWDGQSCVLLVDAQERVVAILGSVPHDSRGAEWQAVEAEATGAVQQCHAASTFMKAQQQEPQVWQSLKTIESLARQIKKPWKSCFETKLFDGSQASRINYIQYKLTKDELLQKQPELRTPFPNTVTFNLGPRSYSPPHMDADNSASGWCADTAMGEFDLDKGGHLVLWDLGLVIQFPPGSTVLFPSALITHSTLPIQEHETRYAMIQYSSGGLFRWRENGFQSDKAFLSQASPAELID